MKKTIIILISLIGVIGLGTVGYKTLSEKAQPKQVSQVETTEETDEINEAKDLNFNMLSFEGGSKELTDFIGEKPIVLNFWASQCPPCVQEMPVFEKAYQENQENVTFVMVNILGFNGESEQSAKRFIRENNYTLPSYFEIEQEATEKFGLSSIPRTVFINKNGEIIDSHMGMISEDELQQGIEQIKE